MLALLVASPAGAVPGAATSDVPWLPLTTPTISVRLAPGPVPDELVPILSQGWRVGADTVERVEQLRRADPSLPDPTRVWRVPASALPVLRGNPAVEAVWGHPPPAEPPDDPADIPPTTPDFEDQQQWLPTFGLSATQWWPGGDGAAVRVYDVEYDILEAHEDLANNPIAALSGDPLGQYLNHGTSVAGIVAASDDGFGTTGGAPAAEVLIVYPMQQGRYDVASAILQAMDDGRPGDVVLIEQQIGSDFGLVAVSADPVTWEAIRLATAAGLVVVEPAGNGGVDLDDPGWGGWWSTPSASATSR